MLSGKNRFLRKKAILEIKLLHNDEWNNSPQRNNNLKSVWPINIQKYIS